MSWSTKKSAKLYGIESWGSGYFSINDEGHVSLKPIEMGPELDLYDLVNELRERGIRPPILIRFPNIIQRRIELLSNCFEQAIFEYGYKNVYSGVYPIKVNQQRHLLEEIIEFGQFHSLGLECGSKPELLVALAMVEAPKSYIVCNGFKDEEYIETALLSQKLGRNTIIVVDRYQELSLIISTAKRLGIRPRIGFRAKLYSKAGGHWVDSTGAKSKFGLTPSEIVQGVEVLKEENMADCLELLHGHIGSQIPSIHSIKKSIKELTRFYTELCELGAGLKLIDVGGGLGVDYDGSGQSESSTNYSEQEYANDIVSIIQSICDEKKIAHPGIISESGRALVAHSSVLVFDVLGCNKVWKDDINHHPEESDSKSVKELFEIFEMVNTDNINEFYNDLIEKRDEVELLFSMGNLSLKQRAKAEDLYWAISTRMLKLSKANEEVEDIFDKLQNELCDTYFGNFSVFQSLPDTWAVDQVFPVMPIQRLDEKPRARATIADLTCDSDGKIDTFIDTQTDQNQSFLEVHDIKEDETYFMGVFLTGAYQETLGDLHNLFGDTDAVHITVTENGYHIDHVVEGDSVTEVLSYVEYHMPELVERVRQSSEAGILSGRITKREARLLMRNYEQGLSGYTYLEELDDL